MLSNFTKEEFAIIALLTFVLCYMFYSWLKYLEQKTTKRRKKPTPKAPLTLEALEKRVIALENKNKPKRK